MFTRSILWPNGATDGARGPRDAVAACERHSAVDGDQEEPTHGALGGADVWSWRVFDGPLTLGVPWV